LQKACRTNTESPMFDLPSFALLRRALIRCRRFHTTARRYANAEWTTRAEES
jgi:hypothetical protein